MRLTHERQAILQGHARRLGALAPRCTEVVGGYAGGVALYCREPIPLWDVVAGAAGGFVVVLSYLLMQLRGASAPPAARPAGTRDWTRTLLDRVPGWRRLDDVPIPGSDVNHVVATPAGLLVIAANAPAAAARRVRRLTALAPNPVDVPVYAAVLLWGPGSGGVQPGWDEATGVYVLAAEQPWTWPTELTTATPEVEVKPASVEEALRKVSGWAAHHERRLPLCRLSRILLNEVGCGLRERRAPAVATA